jgi:hypothetical protein
LENGLVLTTALRRRHQPELAPPEILNIAIRLMARRPLEVGTSL